MDPFEIFGIDVAPLILNHLTVRDLLNCTLVNKNWNEIVGFAAVSKIWLRFYYPFGEFDLLESKRKYTNFKIQHGLPKHLVKVFEKFKWKNVMMRDDHDMKYEELFNILMSFSETIESLDFWDIGTVSSNNKNLHIDFPKLKKLELNLTNRAVFSLFLGRNPKLKDVIFRDEGVIFKNVQQEIMHPTNLIHEFLKLNLVKRLKLLHCEWAFENDLTEGISSEFKAITVTSSSCDCTANKQLNILKFIKLQSVQSVTASKEQRKNGKRFLTVYYE